MEIWFVAGVSGAGKSHFSAYAAGNLGFFHYEIDQTPHDGITHFGLRSQWDAFFKESDADPLIEELARRACMSGCPGAILSFPSNLLAHLSPSHIAAMATVRLIVLTGEPELCKQAFLQHERITGRNYPGTVWETNNRPLYSVLRQPWMSPYLVSAFGPDGSRRTVQELVALVSGA
jgi:hypothetical protein